MADPQVRSRVGPLPLRTEDGRLVVPAEIAAKVSNMVLTEEGSLRAVWGPAPVLSKYSGGGDSTGNPVGSPWGDYGAMHGICHALLRGGGMEVLLVHSGSGIWRYRGSSRDWRLMIGAAADSPEFDSAVIPDDTRLRPPTQFVVMPNGIVIIPQESRAYFYDGDVCLPLGYEDAPGPPVLLGPTSTRTEEPDASGAGAGAGDPGINNIGYAHDGMGYATTAMHPDFGVGRAGTVERFPGATMVTDNNKDSTNSVSGQLLQCQYRGAVAWIDRWSNLSPVSGRSGPVRLAQQRARWWDPDALEWRGGRIEQVRKQLLYCNVDQGPPGTIGRVLYCTGDELNGGSAKLREVPPNAAEGIVAFATICDNEGKVFPYNVSDSMLGDEAPRLTAIGRFSLGAYWDGRLWMAGVVDDPARLVWSWSGRWGTIDEDAYLYPDAHGAGITGILATRAGLFVFTVDRTYMIKIGDDGSYRAVTLSDTIGCVAPSSCVVLGDGRVMWLARRTFASWDGEAVTDSVSDSLRDLLRGLTPGRAVGACAVYVPARREYRCWVSLGADLEQKLCLVYDGEGWRRRDDIWAAAACVTKDNRGLVLVAGTASGPENEVTGDTTWYGAWIVDREVASFLPADRVSVIETAWLRVPEIIERGSPLSVYLWIRESDSTSLTVEVMRDWRGDVIETVDSTTVDADIAPWAYLREDPPAFWGETEYGGDTPGGTGGESGTRTALWRRKRPVLRRVSIGTAAVEVFKLRITGSRWEFLGIWYDDNSKAPSGGGRVSP